MYKRFSIIMLAVALSSCGTPQQKASALEENKEAKSLLEGIWSVSYTHLRWYISYFPKRKACEKNEGGKQFHG